MPNFTVVVPVMDDAINEASLFITSVKAPNNRGAALAAWEEAKKAGWVLPSDDFDYAPYACRPAVFLGEQQDIGCEPAEVNVGPTEGT